MDNHLEDYVSVSERTMVRNPREGSGDLIVHDYMCAFSFSYETAAYEGNFFTKNNPCTFTGTFYTIFKYRTFCPRIKIL